ncbi:MAG: FkbM family methyltransferase [Phycisphaerales bacterium]|nr:FkbM family methyltransferase [Phycisphaerales bacterium]
MPVLLKIDTDGFDGRILRGHQAWLAAVKPVVFMEYCPDYARTADPDIFDTFASLQKAGYQGLVAYLNTGSYRETFLLTNADRLRHMHETFAKPGCTAYLDLALFHTRDMDLYHQLVAWEKSGANPGTISRRQAA